MSRNRKSAKQAGRDMENCVVDYLSWALDTDVIERRRQAGSKDKGDISGVRFMGHRVVIEAKNTAKMDVAQHLREAEEERGNDDALLGIVAQKRRGIGLNSHESQGQQLVMMTLETLALMLNDGQALGPEVEKS
ncbi:MAG: hypothetical protein LKJ47_04920 [Bifidobacteriaceae bacterium]|jgi:hypothetical protein|nr:hypothetical protein [Bifidobacteriaceae bacterium]